MKYFDFLLEGRSVTFTVARYHAVEVYKNRGFSEDEGKYFFAECLRDDSIGQLKRQQLKEHGLDVVEALQ